MAKMKMKMQMQLQIPTDAVMSHFCYTYSKALLEKLKKLIQEDRIFLKGRSVAEAGPQLMRNITDITRSVMSNLGEQVLLYAPTSQPAPEHVDRFVSAIEEFLAIFEAKP